MQFKPEISLDILEDFPSSPFRVNMDADFMRLLKSISIFGVIQPILVRQSGDKFQILSGHRRKRVCEMLHLENIPGIVLDCFDDTEALLLMLDSNLHP